MMLETKSAREMPRYCLPHWRSTRMHLRKWGQASLISASGARISAQNASGSIVSMGAPKSFHTKPASAVNHTAEFWQERRADNAVVGGGRIRLAKEHGRVIK